MTAFHHYYTSTKEQVLKDISFGDGPVRFLFEVNGKEGTKIVDELRPYGKILYEEHLRVGCVGIEINDPRNVDELVDRLYSSGIRGILDLGVDSRSVSFDDR